MTKQFVAFRRNDLEERCEAKEPAMMMRTDQPTGFSPDDTAVSEAENALEKKLSSILTLAKDGGKLRWKAIVRAVTQSMQQIALERMQGLLSHTSNSERTEASFEKSAKIVISILDAFGRDLVGLARRASEVTRSPVPVSELLGAYREIRSEVEADLLLAKQAFLGPRISGEEEQLRSPVNRGGKPLARHWDALWADIAFQLWNGDLQPSTQADIKRAMFAWFNAQEIEVGDTAVIQRARQLWARLEPHI